MRLSLRGSVESLSKKFSSVREIKAVPPQQSSLLKAELGTIGCTFVALSAGAAALAQSDSKKSP